MVDAHLKLDPFTGRTICMSCWNRVHGSRKSPVCAVPDCRCGCKDALVVRRREHASHAAAKAERKALMQRMLEAEDNPLRSYNPDFPH